MLHKLACSVQRTAVRYQKREVRSEKKYLDADVTDFKEKKKDMDNKNKNFCFTVGELIGILKSMPQDLPVIVSGYEGGYENFYQPAIMTMKHQPDNPYYDGEFQRVHEKDNDKNEKTFKAVALQRVRRDD